MCKRILVAGFLCIFVLFATRGGQGDEYATCTTIPDNAELVNPHTLLVPADGPITPIPPPCHTCHSAGGSSSVVLPLDMMAGAEPIAVWVPESSKIAISVAYSSRQSNPDPYQTGSVPTQFVPVDRESADLWPEYVGWLQELAERFPVTAALDVESAEELVHILYLDLGTDRLNELWQLEVLSKVGLAAAHPELSDKTRQTLGDGLETYWADGWGKDSVAIERRFEWVWKQLYAAEQASLASDLSSPSDLCGWVCRCDFSLTPPLPPVCWCVWVCPGDGD